MAGPAIGAPFAGGFYAGAIWDQIDTSASSVAVATGPASFTVSSGNPDIYVGQLLLIAEQGNAGVNYLEAQVTGYAGTTLDVDVLSVAGGGTISSWSIKARWRLVVSPRSGGQLGSSQCIMAAAVADWPTACITLTNGKAATDALYAAGSSSDYPAAHNVKALTINGYSDWYIPARDEVEVLYRNLKPTTSNNNTASRIIGTSPRTFDINGNIADDGGDTFGINRHSFPQGAAYTTGNPEQTSVADFKSGGGEAFFSIITLCSTELSATQIMFGTNAGAFTAVSKTFGNPIATIRVIRRELWREYTNGGDFAAASSLGVASGIDVSRDAALPAGANIASTATTDVAGPAEIVGAPTLAAESNADLGGASDIDGAADLAAAATTETSRAAALGGSPDLAAGSTVDQQADAALTASPDLSSAAPADLKALATFPAGAGLAAAAQVTTYIAPQPIPRRTYLVDIDYVDAAGDPQTLRLTDCLGYTSRAGDDPAWETWLPGLQVTGNIEINLFAPGATQGVAQSGYGEIRLGNAAGRWDHLMGAAFDGRRITVRRLPNERASLSEAVTVFTGAAQYPEYDLDGVSWTIRSRLDVLRVPIQTERYAGTTTSAVAPDRAEGNEDQAGRVKPLAYGLARNVEPVPVNLYSDRVIFQPCANGFDSLPGVYDMGTPLTEVGDDQPDIEALEDEEIPPGAIVTGSADGLFKAGAWPDGKVTCDIVEGATAADRTAAQIVRRILLGPGGQTTGDLVEASFTALDALAEAETGIYVPDERDVIDVISEVLQSVDATLAEDRLGRFGVYQVNLPDAGDTPAETFTTDDVLDDDIEWLPVQDGNDGIPPWQIALRYARNWSPSTRDELAGVVLECADAERISFLTTEWRTVTAEDEAVRTRHPLSKPVTYDSFFDTELAAQAEVDRRFALRSQQRYVVRFPVPAARADALELLDVVALEYPRYGIDAGLLYRVIGMVYDFDRDRITLSLWGGIEPS